MPGTREGGLKASATIKNRYGKSYYNRIGSLGGKKSVGGGFKKNPELARLAGKLGGLKGRRGDTLTAVDMNKIIEIQQQIAALKENAKNENTQG
jgi:general stress protein YciG